MPAETNQHADRLDVDVVLDVLVAILSLDGPPERAVLPDLGLDDDLALFELWDAVAEDLGERSLGHVSLDDLALDDPARVTVRDLADAFLRLLARD